MYLANVNQKTDIGIITYRLTLVYSSIAKYKTQSTGHHREVL